MRKKTKIIIISSIVLVLGLAGTGVGYIFLRHQEGEASAGSIDDPTLQQKYLEREGNSSVNDYISSGNIKDILFVTNNELKNAKYWKSTAEGGVTSVGQFQPVKNERIINYVDDKYGREVFFSTMTYSMFNKTAEIRYTNNTTYLMWRGDIKSMDEANYDASTILEMKSQRLEDVSEENPDVYYFDRYGQLQDGLSNYILNDYTVVDGKYLPEESGDGKYTFYYELCTTNLLDETDNSNYLTRNTAELYKREVKTMSGNDGFPPFNYANLQITIDDNFRILSSVANDGYSINKPLSTSVDSKLSYTFTYFDSYQDVPYYDDLQKHFDTAQNADGGSFGDEDSALNYLAQAGNNLISQDRININIDLFDESNRLPLNLSIKPNMNNLLNNRQILVLSQIIHDALPISRPRQLGCNRLSRNNLIFDVQRESHPLFPGHEFHQPAQLLAHLLQSLQRSVLPKLIGHDLISREVESTLGESTAYLVHGQKERGFTQLAVVQAIAQITHGADRKVNRQLRTSGEQTGKEGHVVGDDLPNQQSATDEVLLGQLVTVTHDNARCAFLIDYCRAESKQQKVQTVHCGRCSLQAAVDAL